VNEVGTDAMRLCGADGGVCGEAEGG